MASRDAGLKTAFLFNSIPYMIVIGPDGKVVSEIDFYKRKIGKRSWTVCIV